MNLVPDRKRLQREYLRKHPFLMLLTASLLASLFLLFVGANGAALLYRNQFPVWFVRGMIRGTITSFIVVPFSAFVVHLMIKARIISSVSYVPPVTPSTLPAEEILVRGAQEPSAPNEILLRATVKADETKADELLRSSQL
jgi:hypothetical protein